MGGTLDMLFGLQIGGCPCADYQRYRLLPSLLSSSLRLRRRPILGDGSTRLRRRRHRPHPCLAGLAAISADLPAARGKAAMVPNSPISATPASLLFRAVLARRGLYRRIRIASATRAAVSLVAALLA